MNAYRLTTTTVAALPAQLPLTTVLNVMTDLALKTADDSEKIYFGRLIRQASASIAQYCNRAFALQTYRDIFKLALDVRQCMFNGFGEFLQLANTPIGVVTSLVENTTTLIEGTDFEVDYQFAKIYRLDPTSGIRVYWTCLPVTVVYQAGWTLPLQDQSGPNKLLDTAPDIEDACIRMVKKAWLSRSRDPNLKSEEIPEVISRTFWIPGSDTGNMPPEIADILDNYRIPAFA